MAPINGLTLTRSVGINGTRLSAMLGAELVGYIEVDSREDAGRLPRNGGWADIGNLHVAEGGRRQGVGGWLVGQTAEWLQLARLDRVLDYAWPEAPECHAFLQKVGVQRTYAYATWLVAEAASILTGWSDRSRRCDHGRDFGQR